jgi:prevent-host-death family protein
MTTIGSYEAKTHLPALLKRVEAGESITITRHGHPIARLVPVTPAEAMGPEAAVEGLLAFRQGRTLGPGLTPRDLVEAGRR